jgi:hypothetical protein
MTPEIRELDVVRVSRLLEPKTIKGSELRTRQPLAGETGTIVAIRESADGARIFTLEAVGADGRTEWLADFWRAEIEPV